MDGGSIRTHLLHKLTRVDGTLKEFLDHSSDKRKVHRYIVSHQSLTPVLAVEVCLRPIVLVFFK